MKQLPVVVVLFIAGMASANLAMADTTQGSGQFGPGTGQPQNLDNIKQRIEQRIQAHISKMQDILNCVQGAQDRQTLRSCLPSRGDHERAGFGPGRQSGNG